ncbi:MAG: serine/threonine protein kinase, partial [Myxococcales bacterium]|nr:serine/threonine protein kinase [Myxococcales bacterium]
MTEDGRDPAAPRAVPQRGSPVTEDARGGLTPADQMAPTLGPEAEPPPIGDVGTAGTQLHASPTPAADLGPLPAVAVGDVLAGRYRVDELLGQGGMGVVYAVWDTELDEPVALKLLRTELSMDPAYRQRLRSEVRLARRVSHPNVCRVHDLGQHRDHLFVTMELVRGPTLRRLLRDMQRGIEAPMPMARVVDLIGQLCAALAAAHRAGVLHRDVKPDNVIVEDGRAVLTDFGVASQAGEGSRVVAGTPSYVAPEILRGEPIDPRADVFAAAVVAYELIAGRLPYHARSMDEAIRRARHGAGP